jgi:hypothetical protein
LGLITGLDPDIGLLVFGEWAIRSGRVHLVEEEVIGLETLF